MSRCIRVYVEGGANGHIADSDFRRGWKKFLGELHDLARQNGFATLEVVRGKGRANTFSGFANYEKRFPDDLCVLLVDSEIGVPDGGQVWDVVARRDGDGWQRPAWATERHLYLMVHMVETWLLTDQDALKRYFKRGFDTDPLPTTDLESRTKRNIEEALEKATKNTSKGAYKHGQAHEIIELVSPGNVKALHHGNRLFSELGSLIVQEGSTPR